MIFFRASGRSATAETDDRVTTGSVGIPVDVELSDEFDGLAATMVFRAGDESADVALGFENPVSVPPQCLYKAGSTLRIGVYAEDGNRNVVIRTVWANVCTIRQGAERSGVDPAEPTPSWAAQVQQWAEDAHDTAERLAEEVDGWETAENGRVSAESGRVAAENRRVAAESQRVTAESQRESAESVRVSNEAGRVSAETARQAAESERASEWATIKADAVEATEGAENVNANASKSGSVATISVTDRTGSSHIVTVRDGIDGRDGTDGVDGIDGVDGYSPTATVTQGDGSATITITDKNGTTTATVHDGTDGRDGTDGADGYSPTARVTQTTTGATISITDKSGTTTASVSNGTDGTDGTDGVDGFSPTVDVQAITGGHEVTITDADGAHSFDVLDGDPSAPGSITDEMLAPDGIKPQVAQLWGNQLVGEMSGTIDTASDAYAAPPMALSVDGASTQAGTPTPDTPVPILSVDDLSLGMCGVNRIYLDSSASGITVQDGVYEGKVVDLNSALRCPYPIPSGSAFTVDVRAVESGTGNLNFIAVRKDTGGLLYMASPPNTQTTWATYTYAINYPVSEIYLYHNASGNRVWQFRNLCVRADGSTAYEPYTGTAVPDLLPEGTSLRSLPDGTKDELHLSYLRPSTRTGWAWYSRSVTAYTMLADMGDLVWVNYYGNRIFYADVSGMANGTADSLQAMCEIFTPYKTATLAWFGNYAPANSIALLDSNTARIAVMLTPETAYESAAAFKAAMSGIYAHVPLATPVTTQLDPIELPELPAPTCTVWCDGGSATPTYTMEYVQDTNIVIAELRAALADLATS